MAGVQKELWLAEGLKAFRKNDAWLVEVPDYPGAINNDVIHIGDIVDDPEVLINNTTYPVDTVDYTDPDDIAISLDKFDTKNTRISDDILYSNALPVIADETERHMLSIRESFRAKAAHALGIASNSATTPLIGTSGADLANGFKAATYQDFIDLAEAMDLLDVPLEDRVLLLHASHYRQLQKQDATIYKEIIPANVKPGQSFGWLQFTVYVVNGNPVYNTSNVKKAFGAAAAGTDRISSIAFIKRRTFKAKGSVKVYPKIDDPEYRASTFGMRVRGIVLPKKFTGFGAVVSQPTA